MRRFERLEQRVLLAGDLAAYWLADDLLSHANGDDPLPAAWVDSVGGRSASTTGMPRLVTDPLSGRALVQFESQDGTDSFLVASRDNPLDNAESFSVVVVFRTDSNQLVGQNDAWFQNTGIVDGSSLGFGRDWGLSINSSGQLATGMGAGLGVAPATVYTEVGQQANDGQLHTVVVTRSGSTLSLSLDDLPPVTRSDVSAAPRDGLLMRFGARADNQLPFDGEIAQIRFYDGALDETEVANLLSEIDLYYGNSAPQANPDSYDVVEDAGLLIVPQLNGVLANDVDSDGDPLTASIVQSDLVGSVQLQEDGSFIYATRRDFFGTETFFYTANDHRPSAQAAVTINVLPAYDAPQPSPDQFLIRPAETLNVPALVGLLVNDSNPDQSPLSVALARPINAGELDLSDDGSFRFDPLDFAGTATFAYEIDDGTQVTGPVEVTIAVNTPPEAVDDTYDLAEDQPLVVAAPDGVLSNDIEQQSDNQLAVTLVTEPSFGALELNESGAFSYQPNSEFSGVDQFQYRVSDGFELSGIATVQLVINAVDDPPIAVADSYLAIPGTAVEFGAADGLLSNDTDVESQPLTARLVTGPTQGTVAVQLDGSFQYRPNAGFEGRDSFSYVANDGTSDSTPAVVNIEVGARPLQLSEILAINTASLPTRLRELPTDRFRGDDQFEDWIELKNVTGVDLNLAGVHLTDDPENLTKWTFPAGTTIPAGQFLVVFASGLDVRDTELDEQGLLHTNFGLRGEGEYLALTAGQGTIVDELSPGYPALFADVSYGRLNGQDLLFGVPTPGSENVDGRIGRAPDVTVSPESGFYDATAQVTLSTSEPDLLIRYTLDGSAPSPTNGFDYVDGISIDSTATLRAAAMSATQLTGPVATHSYIFLDDVVRQSPDGSAPVGWPERPVRGQVFDYGMDPEIVDDPAWSSRIHEALTQIPSLSIVMDQEDLTGNSGIYTNASRDGRNWERPASIEFVYPESDGRANHQIDAGLRIRGGFSRGGFNPKHSFRLFFRDAYDGPLQVPLFEDEGASQFSAVDLRTAQNYAWSNDTFNDQTRNSFLRDIFSRDLQGQVGQLYTRGRYYHLYLNGQYWGLYQTEERPEATFAATYLGGSEEDYDVIKASGGVLEATDGDLQPWRDLWAIANRGFETLEHYFLIQGKNPDGTDNPNLEVHVQIDQVIDFALNYMFTGNQDMPTSLGNNVANNFWAIRNPATRDGWQFIAHDNEHNMLAADDDQTRDDPAGNVVTSFNPKYLHQQLDALPEYRLRFADRVQKYFFNDGPFTRENAQALMQTRVEQIDQAIVAESARWGDQHNDPPLDENTWLAEVDWLLNTFLATRTETVLGQFRARGLYPDVSPVELNQHGGLVESGFQLDMSAPEPTIYFTLDGRDPRQVGGDVLPEALVWTADSGVILERDTRVMARAWNGTEWSALTEADFLVGTAVAPTSLRISEINYHPPDPTESERSAGFDDDDDFEFIELANPSSEPLDLTRARFQRVDENGTQVGIDFDFSTGAITRLAPGERVVVVEDRAAFEFRYGEGLPIAGQWSGGLNNAAELLTLVVDGLVSQQFGYDDGWHPTTDGGGVTLEIVNVDHPDLNHWATAAAWRPSYERLGTPGRAPRIIGDANGDGVFDSTDLVLAFAAGEYEDEVLGNSTFAEGDWNGDGDFTTADLVIAFQSQQFLAAAIALDNLTLGR